MKNAEVERRLRKSGKAYFVKHGKKHDEWYSKVTKHKFYLLRHPAKELSSGTLKDIESQSGIKLH